MKQRIKEIYKTKKSKYSPEQLEGMSIDQKHNLFKQLLREAVFEASWENCALEAMGV